MTFILWKILASSSGILGYQAGLAIPLVLKGRHHLSLETKSQKKILQLKSPGAYIPPFKSLLPIRAEGAEGTIGRSWAQGTNQLFWLQLPPPLHPQGLRTTHLSGALHGNDLAEFFYHNFSTKIPWKCHRTVSMIKVHVATDPSITIHCQNKLPESYLSLIQELSSAKQC